LHSPELKPISILLDVEVKLESPQDKRPGESEVDPMPSRKRSRSLIDSSVNLQLDDFIFYCMLMFSSIWQEIETLTLSPISTNEAAEKNEEASAKRAVSDT
jgi:hypothetical protein